MAPARTWLVVFGSVLSILNSNGTELTQQELVKASGYSIRSVKAALKVLVEAGHVSELVLGLDLRRKRYAGGNVK